MVPMGCETRRCRGRCVSGRVCHVVSRRRLASCCRPGGRPVGHDVVGRYYDPQTGQFLSVDPLVDATGQPYAYARDDPVDSSDPTGNCGNFPTGVCEQPNGGGIFPYWDPIIRMTNAVVGPLAGAFTHYLNEATIIPLPKEALDSALQVMEDDVNGLFQQVITSIDNNSAPA